MKKVIMTGEHEAAGGLNKAFFRRRLENVVHVDTWAVHFLSAGTVRARMGSLAPDRDEASHEDWNKKEYIPFKIW